MRCSRGAADGRRRINYGLFVGLFVRLVQLSPRQPPAVDAERKQDVAQFVIRLLSKEFRTEINRKRRRKIQQSFDQLRPLHAQQLSGQFCGLIHSERRRFNVRWAAFILARHDMTLVKEGRPPHHANRSIIRPTLLISTTLGIGFGCTGTCGSGTNGMRKGFFARQTGLADTNASIIGRSIIRGSISGVGCRTTRGSYRTVGSITRLFSYSTRMKHQRRNCDLTRLPRAPGLFRTNVCDGCCPKTTGDGDRCRQMTTKALTQSCDDFHALTRARPTLSR